MAFEGGLTSLVRNKDKCLAVNKDRKGRGQCRGCQEGQRCFRRLRKHKGWFLKGSHTQTLRSRLCTLCSVSVGSRGRTLWYCFVRSFAEGPMFLSLYSRGHVLTVRISAGAMAPMTSELAEQLNQVGTPWEVTMLNAPCEAPGQCCFACCCMPCNAATQRELATSHPIQFS